MSKKTTFNRIDTIKDSTAKTEIARAHTMIALLGVISIILLWIIYSIIDVPRELVLLACILLLLIVLFSAAVVFSLLSSRKRL